MGTSFGGLGRKKSEGTQVVGVSDPGNPVLSTNLTSPAMVTGTWETLKVNEQRGLLAGVSVGPALGALFFDVYDISQDCAHPKLLNSLDATNLTLPANVLGHEGQWVPDGLTYYASGLVAVSLTAVARPARCSRSRCWPSRCSRASWASWVSRASTVLRRAGERTAPCPGR